MNSKGNVPSAAKPVKDLGGLMRWRKYVKCHYSQKHYVFFILALDTGIAPGKLLKLTWEQIENQTIFDPVSGEQLEMTLLRLLELTKAGNKKLIKISDEDAQEIKQLRAGMVDDVYLFQTETRRLSGIAQPWSQGYVTAFLKESAASSGLQEKVGFLTLQKTWGYQLAVRGNYTLSEIQRILGQRSLAATRSYLDVPAFEKHQDGLAHLMDFCGSPFDLAGRGIRIPFLPHLLSPEHRIGVRLRKQVPLRQLLHPVDGVLFVHHTLMRIDVSPYCVSPQIRIRHDLLLAAARNGSGHQLHRHMDILLRRLRQRFFRLASGDGTCDEGGARDHPQ